jgi:hypothetical protein
MNEYIKILSTKNSHNFPIRYLMVYPFPHTSYRGAILYIFVLFVSPKLLLFYTFSFFIPTFPKILLLLLSYFSTQGCQKAWWSCLSHMSVAYKYGTGNHRLGLHLHDIEVSDFQFPQTFLTNPSNAKFLYLCKIPTVVQKFWSFPVIGGKVSH